jgi:hypothetical protein
MHGGTPITNPHDDAELTCSQVIDVESLLHDTLVSVDRNIMRPLQVSLKKGRKASMCASGSLGVLSLPPVFVSTAFVLG